MTDDKGQPDYSKALVAVAFIILALLAFVIVSGVVQGTLNGTGVASALITALTGIVAGLVLRERDKGDKGDPS